MYYNDKVIWITGASSGIGEALAYALNKRGARLILSARRVDELERVQALCDNGDTKVKILQLDLADAGSIESKAEEAIELFGRVDMLFNNGGISQRALALDATMDSVRRMMEVNFFGTVAITKAVLPQMLERGHGHIVVTSSVMGKIGTRYRSAYAATKHALHGWFDCLRQEVLREGIHVTLVCPGFVKTDITKNALQADGTPFRKMGELHKKAMTADQFAEKLLPKVSSGKEEIYIGGKEILTIYLKRFMPKLLNKLLLRMKVT